MSNPKRRRPDPREHHAAHLDRSQRLQRLLRALCAESNLSSLELVRRSNIVGLSAAIDELRKQGHRIECTRSGGIWRYRLIRNRRRSRRA